MLTEMMIVMVMMGMFVIMLNDSVVDSKDCCSFLF